MELQQVIAEFLSYCELEKCARKSTLRAYGTDLRMFLLHLQEQNLPTLIGSITTPVVRRCLIAMQAAFKYKPASMNRRIDTLRSMFRFAQEQGYIIQSPVEKIKSPKLPKALPVFLSEAELRRLLSMPEQKKEKQWIRDRAILYLLGFTGVRRCEVLSLQWHDIRFDEKTIRVHGKGDQERVLPMHPELERVLWEHLETQLPIRDPAVFKDTKGNPFQRWHLHSMFKRYIRYAGLDPAKISLHKIRHTFATLLLSSGTDLRTIQELLGHNDISSTQIYTHTSPARTRAAVNNLLEDGAR